MSRSGAWPAVPPIGPSSALVSGRGSRRRVQALILDGTTLWHYSRRTDRPDRPWERLTPVSVSATAPAALLDTERGLLCWVPETEGGRCYLLVGAEWRPQPGQLVPPEVTPPTSLVSSLPATAVVASFGRGALVADGAALLSYHQVGSGWEPDACLWLRDPEPFEVDPLESEKVAQVSGELDATLSESGQARPTLSRSVSTAGVRGTDLGVRFDHAGRSFLLFGDTHWSRPWLATRDSIAEVFTDAELPEVRFHGSPLKLTGPLAGWVTMREYDVPLDAFSHGGRLYGLFTSNHFRHGRVMGRSVLAVASDPVPVVDPEQRGRPFRFRALGTLSARHFINASVQLVPAAAVPGFGADGQVLLLWGTGAYRASEPRLAVLDQAGLAQLQRRSRWPIPLRPALKYWTGAGWSESEAEAAAILRPAALGELSVRWVPQLQRYLMLTAASPGDPAGPAVLLRSAAQPWGPWSKRLRLLDWIRTGMDSDPHRRFIKSSRFDPVGDRIFGVQADSNGAGYAPYLFDAEVEGEDLVLRYTFSTWNPYQVVLMRHRVPVSKLI